MTRILPVDASLHQSRGETAWRYVSGGDPFGIAEDRTDREFLERIQAILDGLEGVSLHAQDENAQISERMRELRASPLPDRRSLYFEGRIDSQGRWYSYKSKINASRSKLWGAAASGTTFAGVVAAALRSFVVVEVDLLGVLSVLASAANAWERFRQHRTLAASYAVAAQELGVIAGSRGDVHGEADWSRFVSDAEDAISREHTLWLARKSRVGDVGGRRMERPW